MAKQYAHIPERWARFITQQKIFFVATATCDSRVNVSPKGLDSLRILDPNRVAWLNLTGSGNESAAHVQSDPRMTLMFCAFGGEPIILRLYGTARAFHQADPAWPVLAALFPPLPGARQIFDVAIDLVRLRGAVFRLRRRPAGPAHLDREEGRGGCAALLARAQRRQHRWHRDRDRRQEPVLIAPARKPPASWVTRIAGWHQDRDSLRPVAIRAESGGEKGPMP